MIDSSSGSLLPFVGRPWGMNNWAIQTNNYAGARASPLTHWWFHPHDREFYGIRCTHQASPWIYDYGEFLLTPSVGPLKWTFPDKASAYNRSSATFHPYEINITLESYCTHNEADGGCTSAAVTATERAAMIKLRFPPLDKTSGWDQTRHLRVLVGRDMAAVTDSITSRSGSRAVVGRTSANSGGVPIGLRPMRPDQLKRAGTHRHGSSAMSSHCLGSSAGVEAARAMSFAHGLHFLGHDIGNATVPVGEEPAVACAEACAKTEECQAFSVDIGISALSDDGDDSSAAICNLKSRAVHRHTDGQSATLVGWLDSAVPQVEIFNFAHHFHMEFDEDIKEFKKNIFRDDKMYRLGLEGIVSFDESVTEVNIRIGTSFISAEQASLNLEREIPPGTTFEGLREMSRRVWNDLLARTELRDIGNSTSEEGDFALRTWYTNLYRASVYPRMNFEYDVSGDPVHYSPYDSHGRIFPGVLSTDSGFWDAYRTVYPLGSIIRANQTALQMDGWLNAYKESGHLPGWASPGTRGAMTGNMQDASIADAIIKGLFADDDKANLAYKAILDDTESMKASNRKGLKEYESMGYVPVGRGIGDEVAVTLNYALADFSVALAATERGDSANAARLQQRSERAWRSVWRPKFKGGFFAPKQEDGNWQEPFDEFGWGGAYTEASAWQYRFYLPHDPEGLRDAYAAAPGNMTMCDFLKSTMEGRGVRNPGSTYHNGDWGLHHEQVEMVESGIGEYEHNNQPVWHQLYMFAPAGCAADGQYWLRQAMSRLYSPSRFSGDEDNGSMSAWFILSAMGIYQLVPGSTRYSIGSPLHRHVSIALDNGRHLEILAEGNTPQTPYVHAVHFNETALTELAVDYW
eukprot:CAMPEP_0172894864 /NCGR_PEP_ID=MMETSP1075-20121228/151810_1 /TAXON_ID=2916 /ORGANISM="Ceratium fusus, Strain PA161109" /LENGTH=859 /DNA_ID=CAMNT_0013749963 /DNA_START=142 /DNA_END=2718 /DNA_ORIENTATION=-